MAELKIAVLSKRGRNRSGLNLTCSWAERKIVLYKSNLVYGPPDGPPKDSVAINKTTKAEPCDVDKKEFAFKVTTVEPPEELILNCDSESERQDWMGAIRDVANPPAVNPDKSAEEIALEEQAREERLKREREIAEAEANALKSTDTFALREEREAADAAKKKAHEEAEARRLAEEKAYKERVIKAEAERVEKEKALKFVKNPTACRKKLSNEESYQNRFIFINTDAKEFHWGKSIDDCAAGKSKGVSISKLLKVVRSNAENSQPNFSFVFNDDADLPDHVWKKTVFSSTAPTSIDIAFEDDANACKMFTVMLNELSK